MGTGVLGLADLGDLGDLGEPGATYVQRTELVFPPMTTSFGSRDMVT